MKTRRAELRAPGNGAPAVGAPAVGASADGTPADGTPADGTPADGTPAVRASAARPLGADAPGRQAEVEMGERFIVMPLGLNLRSEPRVEAATRLALLPQGQVVERLQGTAGDEWWSVTTTFAGSRLEGWVASRYLEPLEDPPPADSPSPAPVPASGSAPSSSPALSPAPIGMALPAVHLQEGRPDVTRDRVGMWAFPLGEAEMPRRTASTPAARVRQLAEIVRFLAVERSARYARQGGSTYCNVYAHDYCYLAGAYLPRVWWTATAMAALVRGEPVKPAYGKTVKEVNANGLFDWLEDEQLSVPHGWQRVFETDAIQEAANAGHVAIIIAQRAHLNLSGHVCAVVPETGEHSAVRTGGTVSQPLQSQAGLQNFEYGTGLWWRRTTFRAFGFWVHD